MTVHYHSPKNEEPIDTLYAYLSYDENGEGIVSALINGEHVPFIGGYKRIMDALEPMAIQVAKEAGKNIRLVRFKRNKVLKEFNYGKTEDDKKTV